MNPLSPSQCRGEAVCRPVEQTIRRLVGERKLPPRSTSCQIWLDEESIDGQFSRREIFVPAILNGSGLSGTLLHDQLLAGLLPGELREIEAITASGIVWLDPEEAQEQGNIDAGPARLSPEAVRSAPEKVQEQGVATDRGVSRRVSNKLQEIERLTYADGKWQLPVEGVSRTSERQVEGGER